MRNIEKFNKCRRKNYAICRKLGFSSYVASRLAKRSGGRIRELVKKHRNGDSMAFIKTLIKKASDDKINFNKRRREFYSIYRRLGFSSYEAHELAKNPEDYVRQIVRNQKDKQKRGKSKSRRNTSR